MAKIAPDPSELHLEEVVPEEQFVSLLQKNSRGFFLLCNFLATTEVSTWVKKHFYQCVTEANEFETFLDDYGARYNKTFGFFTELVASLRGFGLAGHSLKHLQNRYDKYGVEGEPAEHQEFSKEIASAVRFIGESMLRLAGEAVEEAGRLRLAVPSEKLPEGRFSDTAARKRLPRNVDEEDLVNEEQKIAEVASKYLRAVELFEGLKVRKVADPEKRRAFIERHCSEERARVYEATVHNLQSKYDTYVKNTTLEKKDPRLGALRGHISVALHLLEAVTYLVHFYERHENDIRSEKAKERIAGLIDKNAVLDKVLNFGIYHADRVLRRGKALAEGLLPHYADIQTIEVVLSEGRYLHARPASLIVSIVNHYGMPVEMEIAGSKCNAASIMQVMVLAGTHPGAKTFKFCGDVHPLRDIQLLFDRGLGENGLEELPEQLSYLRGG